MFIICISVLFLLTLFISMHIKDLSINNSYGELLNKDYTMHVRGIAILIIMISHLILFVHLYPNLQLQYHEKIIMFFINNFTHIGVGLFLFLSGYGNWYSIKKQENKNRWIINKLVRLYIPVGVLVVFSYILANLFNLQILFPHWWTPIKNFATLSVVMWSFWYLKVQAMAYVILFIAVSYFNNHKVFICTTFFLSYLIFCLFFNIGDKWWFTSLCFPLGCIIADYKEYFIKAFNNKKTVILDVLIISLLLLMRFLFKQSYFMVFISLVACIIMTKLSNIFDLKSKILNFFGKYSLELYLIHLALIPILRNAHYKVFLGGGGAICIFICSVILSPILKRISTSIIGFFDK